MRILKRKMLILFIFGLSFLSSNSNAQENITCTDTICFGTYQGPEYKNFSDVAHQFSNHMSAAVGDKLKELYKADKYSKVDLPNIKMETIDMNQVGNVTYKLEIPIIRVEQACDAFTSFDHRGGWGHRRDSLDVVREFRKVDNLEILEKTTPEGLQEFWAQWRHSAYQSGCK